MSANHHLERVRQSFADQFEPEGTAFLYRKSMKGAPILVTEAERDRFISDFNRRQRRSMWAIPFATFAFIGLLTIFTHQAGEAAEQLVFWAGLTFLITGCTAPMLWAWNAPARELRLRSPAGEARSRREVRQLMFAKMTYGQLGVAAIGAVFMVLRVSAKNDVLHGWGRLWLVAAVGLIALAGVQAVRKWKYERN
jgi:hypothetical protein